MSGLDLEQKVRLFCSVAKANGSLLSLGELLELLPEQRTQTELELAIKSSPGLDSTYEVRSGFIVERSAGRPAETRDAAGRLKAKSNRLQAEGIAPLLNAPGARTIGISGSTSYGSASKSEDLDFFCVTDVDSLWIFLTRALVVSRAIKYLRRPAPEICLSCTIDTEYAERFFSTRNDPLFARDALSMIVLSGKDYYRHLIGKGLWMRSVYPLLYSTRLGDHRAAVSADSESSIGRRVLNRLLYATVGNYIRFKSFIHNREFLKRGQSDSVFKLLLGENHCIYESVRYTKIKRMYEGEWNR